MAPISVAWRLMAGGRLCLADATRIRSGQIQLLHLSLNRINQLLLDPGRDHSNGPVEGVGDRLPITTSVTDGTDSPRPQQWSAAILGVVESTADFL